MREVLYEFRRVGGQVRVAAIDPVTATEVTVAGPAGAGTEMLQRIAARKLAYVIAKTGRTRSSHG